MRKGPHWTQLSTGERRVVIGVGALMLVSGWVGLPVVARSMYAPPVVLVSAPDPTPVPSPALSDSTVVYHYVESPFRDDLVPTPRPRLATGGSDCGPPELEADLRKLEKQLGTASDQCVSKDVSSYGTVTSFSQGEALIDFGGGASVPVHKGSMVGNARVVRITSEGVVLSNKLVVRPGRPAGPRANESANADAGIAPGAFAAPASRAAAAPAAASIPGTYVHQPYGAGLDVSPSATATDDDAAPAATPAAATPAAAAAPIPPPPGMPGLVPAGAQIGGTR